MKSCNATLFLFLFTFFSGIAALKAPFIQERNAHDSKNALRGLQEVKKTAKKTGKNNKSRLSEDVEEVIVNHGCEHGVEMTMGTVEEASIFSRVGSYALLCGIDVDELDDVTFLGTWYDVVGTGETLQFSACSSIVPAKVTVYTGECDDLQCVSYGDSCEFEFATEEGQFYHVLVMGSESLVEVEDTAFRASVAIIEGENECTSTFVDLPIDSTHQGRVDEAFQSLEYDFTNCSSVSSTSLGTWYTVNGTGGTMVASACMSDIAIEVSLVGGNCSALECMHYTGGCEIEWVSELGTQHHILLINASEMVDVNATYELTVVDVGDPVTSIPGCENVIEVFVGEAVSASTFGEIEQAHALCQNSIPLFHDDELRPGAWFMIAGTGERIRASVCQDAGLDVVLFQGSCDYLECGMVYTTVGCAVEWASIVNETYFFLVQNTESGVNSTDFELFVEETYSPVNDACIAATPLEANGTVVAGLSHSASEESIEHCGREIRQLNPHVHKPGVWYEVVGSGSRMRASTCSGNSPTVQVSVFEGNCSTLSCPNTTQTRACSVEWESDVDETFLILVQQIIIGGDLGEFELIIEGNI